MGTLLTLTLLGILVLAEGLLKKKSWLLPTILMGLAAAFVLNILPWGTNRHLYNEMLVLDNSAIAFSAVMIATTFLIFLLAGHYYREVKRSLDDIYAILIFSLVGAVMMVSFGNLIVLFLGMETMSIALYVLAGSHKEAITSNEATLKYFLQGTFMSAFLLFGIALIYGATGSCNLHEIAAFVSKDPDHLNGLFKTGLFLLIIGMAFKIAIVPFHFWAPDVYDGTPTLLTAYMTTVVKIAGIISLYRLFTICFISVSDLWETLLWILAVLTILLGNLTGLFQANLKRMLAYSSISHSGYMMLAILAFSARTPDALLLYTISYSVATVLAFGVLILVRGATGNDAFASFNGMAKKNPLEAFCLTVAMLSLTGIPPLAGFMAKYYLFTTALEQGFIWLVLIALLGSLISVAYYFRPVISMYMKEGDPAKMESGLLFRANLVFLTILLILVGILPFVFINLLQS